jgi:hypothetical protein
MTLHMALIGSPVILGLLVRLLRRPQGALTELVRNTRDLLTLRMVLRDSEPAERGDLLDAHRGWRSEATNQATVPEAHQTRRPAGRSRTRRG